MSAAQDAGDEERALHAARTGDALGHWAQFSSAHELGALLQEPRSIDDFHGEPVDADVLRAALEWRYP